MSLDQLQESLGIRFVRLELLELAVTHSSFVHEKKIAVELSNERLEFLGDAVLNLCVAQTLTEVFPQEPEGALSKRRAALVNQKRLAGLAKDLKLGTYLRLGKGEEKTGGRTKESLLADAYEALIGAIYLDQGFLKINEYLRHIFDPLISKVRVLAESEDFKTRLQEWLQKRFRRSPKYVVVHESGPDHEKLFRIQIEFFGQSLGVGEGRSKREAEQNAAKMALKNIDEVKLMALESKYVAKVKKRKSESVR